MASENTVLPETPKHVEKTDEIKIVKRVDILKGSENEEKLKDEELPNPPASSSELKGKIDYKPIELLLVEEVKKTDDSPVLEYSVEDKSPPDNQPTIDSVEPKKGTSIESYEKKPGEQPPVGFVKKQPEDEVKMIDTLEPEVEAIEKIEKAVEVLTVEEPAPKPVAVKEVENSNAEPKKEELWLLEDPVVAHTPQKQPETAKNVDKECVEVEPKENHGKVEEVPTKPSSKQSNIMAKLKHSLVKAKKVILGKSPNSKTVSAKANG